MFLQHASLLFKPRAAVPAMLCSQDVCKKYNIPTAAYEAFTDAGERQQRACREGEDGWSTSAPLACSPLLRVCALASAVFTFNFQNPNQDF